MECHFATAGLPAGFFVFWKYLACNDLHATPELASRLLYRLAPDPGSPASEANRSRTGAGHLTTEQLMKKDRKERAAEPIGIVISSGATIEQPPHFSAYVWGPAPEPERHAVESGQKSF